MPTALVTGASRGLGRAISEEFVRLGWQVIAPTRDEMDLRDGAAIQRWGTTLEAGTRIDALIHSAGVNWPKPVGEISEEIWTDTLQINLTALRQLVQIVAPRMVSQGGGRILALSSIFGIVSRAHRAAYSATKAAVNGFMRTLAIEYGASGILANALCPGYIDTDLTRQNNTPEQIAGLAKNIPLGRLGKPEEIARLAVWLCSDQNTYLTGQAIVIDGGFTCL